ncbi:hypothetical protein PoB_003864100 [Plakobranchus ocellatus]|uniref:Uncharacterized protein n=1 Tax=Plakobranchus ocellatus TaxID=259542 RepID=A0AAV4B010_9GAST|nr:hypothetical protein PoB_003864100 [Plakobranchus ocellatus]
MFKGNKLNELKGGNKKFSRGGDGVGFQPTIAHHYVFHVGRPTDTTLLNTLAPVLVAHGLLTHGTTKASLASNQADQKLIQMMCVPAS